MAAAARPAGRRRLVTVLLVVGPWVGYNMSRFDDPVFISSGFGVTLASSNCATALPGTL